MRRFVLLVAAAVLVLGCGASGGSAGGGAQTIVETEMRFSPNRIDAKAGQPVVVRIVNEGSQRHDLAFPSLNMPRLAGIETELQPGESTTITLQFDEPGVYTFICTIPGHFASGMSGAAYVTR